MVAPLPWPASQPCFCFCPTLSTNPQRTLTRGHLFPSRPSTADPPRPGPCVHPRPLCSQDTASARWPWDRTLAFLSCVSCEPLTPLAVPMPLKQAGVCTGPFELMFILLSGSKDAPSSPVPHAGWTHTLPGGCSGQRDGQ